MPELYELDNECILYNNLAGTYKNGVANCKIDNSGFYKGNITLFFKGNDVIEAALEYIKTDEYHKKDEVFNGCYDFEPYKIKDIDYINPAKTRSYPANLNSWGDVNIVTVVTKGNKKCFNRGCKWRWFERYINHCSFSFRS